MGPESSPSGLIRLPAPKALLVSASGTAENQTGAIGILGHKNFGTRYYSVVLFYNISRFTNNNPCACSI